MKTEDFLEWLFAFLAHWGPIALAIFGVFALVVVGITFMVFIQVLSFLRKTDW